MEIGAKLNSIAKSWHQIAFKGKCSESAVLKREPSETEQNWFVGDISEGVSQQTIPKMVKRKININRLGYVTSPTYRFTYTIMRFEKHRK